MREKYQVFISFRNSYDNGARTKDADMAEELYYALEKQGIHAFYSNISIHQEGVADFGQMIDIALEECEILIAVGTSVENMESAWVKHEIDTHRNEMLSGNKNESISALCSYITNDIRPKDLPMALRKNQAFKSLNDVVGFVVKRLNGFEEVEKNFEEDSLVISTDEQISLTDSQGKADVFSVGCLIDGKFEILKLIGKGGMSEIYLASHVKLAKVYAMKVVRLGSAINAEIVKQSFYAELNLLKRFDNIHIPKIYDVFEMEDRICIIMDFIEGSSLSIWLTNNIKAEYEKVIDWGLQLCDVLSYLHSRQPKVIYRDMKPANIILQSNGILTLLDFGTCREYNPAGLGDTTCLGTIGYAAPEQYGGMGQSDERTDIFGLGMTLYHLATGINPNISPYNMPQLELIENIGLRNIIAKCIEKDPDNRYQNVEEVIEAFNNIDKLKLSTILSGLLSKRRSSKTKNKVPSNPISPVPTPVIQPPLPKLESSTVPGMAPMMETDTTVLAEEVFPVKASSPKPQPVPVQPMVVKPQPMPVQPTVVKPQPAVGPIVQPVVSTPQPAVAPIVQSVKAKEPVETLTQKTEQPIASKKQRVVVCVCSNVVCSDEKEQFLHVYIFGKESKEHMKQLIFRHKDYMKVELGKTFTVDESEMLSIKVKSTELFFDAKEITEKWDGKLMYVCFRRTGISREDKDRIGKAQVTIEVCQDEQTLSEVVMEFERNE